MEGENSYFFSQNSDQSYSNYLLERDIRYQPSIVYSLARSQDNENMTFAQQQNSSTDNALNLQAFPSFSTANVLEQNRPEHIPIQNHLTVHQEAEDVNDDLTNDSISNVMIQPTSDEIEKANEGGLCIKGQWTADEDRMVVDLMKEYGPRKWCLIAKHIEGRNGKQCRERWINHLRPCIKKNMPWTESEEKMMVAAHKILGNKWAEIARHIPDRSENSIKNHWNATVRKQSVKRKIRRRINTRNGTNPSTVLEDYVKAKYFSEASTSNSEANPSDSAAMFDADTASAATNDHNPQPVDLTMSSPDHEEEEEPNSYNIFEDFDDQMNFIETLFEDKRVSNGLTNNANNPSSLPAQVGNGLLNSSSESNNMEGSGSINTATEHPDFQPDAFLDFTYMEG